MVPTRFDVLGDGACPEAELLLCCGRMHLDSDTVDHMRTLLRKDLDWGRLLAMAEKHRVMPLLYRNLFRWGSHAVPGDTFKVLRSSFLFTAQRNLVLTRTLLRLLHLFHERTIRTIPYKGTVLAKAVYGKVSLRQVHDLDLLVHERDFQRGRELLLSHGYVLAETFDQEQSFRHRKSNIEVDLHWGFAPFYFPLKVDFDGLWQRIVPVDLDGSTAMTFSPEDLLLILCIQVAKDSWERRQQLEHLSKVCDIAELIRVGERLDWCFIIHQAGELGVARILHFGLCLARELLGARIPQDVWTHVENDTMARPLAKQVCAALSKTAGEQWPSTYHSRFAIRSRIKQLIFYLRIRERRADRLKHITEILLTLFMFGRR